MKFSNKAYKYLEKLKRNEDCICLDKGQIENYFRGQGLPVFEKVVVFQIDYSGLELTISKKPLSSFQTSLFTASEIRTNAAINYLQINGRYYFYCGEHKTAQFWFGIGQDGEICTLGDEDDSVNIVFSSFEKFIETYAFQNLLSESNKYEHPPFYNLLDKNAFDCLVKDYFMYASANDHYNSWMSKDDLIIHQGILLDEPAYYVHVYGDDKLKCETYIQMLRTKGVIE